MANLKEQLARKLSTLDVPTTEQTTETKSVDVGTNGDNANAEYNDVNGNQ